VKLASSLRNEHFKPDTFRGRPLCMHQFRALFGTSRVPRRHSKDAIAVYEKSNHVAVMCRNQLYYFQALWPDTGDVAVDEDDLLDILRAIRSDSRRAETAAAGTAAAASYPSSLTAVGVLTSLSRKEWAVAREEMIAHRPTKNAESLRIVDSALFVLVLDDYVPKNRHEAAANMLHGSYELSSRAGPPATTTTTSDGSHHHPAEYQTGSCTNRWYDKLQIIVCGDGTAGINFEHSAIDGHTALRFVSDIYADTVISFAKSITKMVQAHGAIPDVIEATVRRAAVTLDGHGRTTLDVFPKRINFDLPDSVRRKIYFAETALGDQIVACELYVLEFSDYGKVFITSNKMSPDSYIQMSMMLAYYQLYGRMVCAYEPVLTKSFYHGRTEAMRPATTEAKRLCEVFCNPKAGPREKLAALRDATRVHSQRVKECAGGKGVDRHLFALKCIAEKDGLPVPAFFRSQPWTKLNHTVLSTSNCGNPALAHFGFGPVVPDGLGIGYIIKDTSVHYTISSKHRQTTRYALTLESVLREMAKLLEPVGQTHVRNSRRASLKEVAFSAKSNDSYCDIWGESTPQQKPKLPMVPLLGSKLSDKPSEKIMERRWSAEIKPLDEEDLLILEGAVQERRWSAEIEPPDEEHLVAMEGNSEEACVVGLLSPISSVGGIGMLNGESENGSRKLKRRGSNDMLPVKPDRRGSQI
jgi:carnitine O-acetyltransferase